MEQRQLGGSGLWVSRLGLGTMNWGKDTGEEEAAHQVATFLDAGGTFVDTADIYAGGDSERILGRLLHTVARREDLVIGTKAGHSPQAYRPQDTSRRHLLAALDASLSRLGTEHVDLWQVHVYDPDTPTEETLAALDTAVASGRVRYVGVGNVTAWQFTKYATWQRAVTGRTPVISVGTEYSLVNRRVETDLLPAVADAGAGLLAWSPLGRGVLTGKYRDGRPDGSRGAAEDMAAFVEPYFDERSRRIVESVCTAARGLGVSAHAVALSWVRDQPYVASTPVGARTAPQLEELLASEALILPREIRDALDDASADAVGPVLA
ncbi:aldo/keto reductase [Lipingzhangella sp. LS1_29]|uniref:Aldo/keto reductase n=1 Tax=Lipingzhangella rawalii TaxID=2055835 RepID=A0ABU2H0T8_9ACTN|nr:aldo/keto reductase [Lipingzhangella rawalii]MDS1268921.1 aldo/keto reductase [Lipingzhangella rawalii]